MTGFVPIAGQLGDARDLVHILDEICNREGYKKISSWATLVLIIIAFVSGVGDAIAKVGKKGIKALDNNQIIKKVGEFLGENIITIILGQVEGLTAPVVKTLKSAILSRLESDGNTQSA